MARWDVTRVWHDVVADTAVEAIERTAAGDAPRYHDYVAAARQSDDDVERVTTFYSDPLYGPGLPPQD